MSLVLFYVHVSRSGSIACGLVRFVHTLRRWLQLYILDIVSDSINQWEQNFLTKDSLQSFSVSFYPSLFFFYFFFLALHCISKLWSPNRYDKSHTLILESYWQRVTQELHIQVTLTTEPDIDDRASYGPQWSTWSTTQKVSGICFLLRTVRDLRELHAKRIVRINCLAEMYCTCQLIWIFNSSSFPLMSGVNI